MDPNNEANVNNMYSWRAVLLLYMHY